ncbi:hypothetical protein SARC_04195 [Sphaeroforma arctica JP610]|uniref:proton-translocating NAD(P)(+) transhydrogenase n=1 Tax=Sphaeroforma arctica JP610 TaxID=667725 RepID=A0A0L0G5M5_9EUKA|nr:hypothetical protein SARC_04195 [Sphaeroforma arctica JP610]KNC83548.1 hypothetical protein SARC_04195 [Sphaeroforma arctica JP610]|eukprot:XP_014157450.1 hypothetical protein SARC_04195 [Sphaeroforma arctica JP610]
MAKISSRCVRSELIYLSTDVCYVFGLSTANWIPHGTRFYFYVQWQYLRRICATKYNRFYSGIWTEVQAALIHKYATCCLNTCLCFNRYPQSRQALGIQICNQYPSSQNTSANLPHHSHQQPFLSQTSEEKPKKTPLLSPLMRALLHWLLLALLMIGLGFLVPVQWQARMLIFVLACGLGYMLVWDVHPSLHTPLMSVTNAISGVVIISGLELIGGALDNTGSCLGLAAAIIASVNVFGGFAVTQRMLNMFTVS